jgi:hypothetical protein
MISLPRIALALFGLGCLAAAAIVDMELVRKHASADGYFEQTHVSVDGAVKPEAAAALRAARVVLGLFGLMLVGAAACLPRIFPGQSVQSVLRSRRVHWLVFLTPIAIIVALGGYKARYGLDTFLYKLLVTEDGPAEYLTAIAFMISFGIGCFAAKLLFEAGRRYLAIYFALLSIFCLFVGLEEISYGQRIFGFSTPDSIAQHNRQDEFNVHNIDMLGTLIFGIGPITVGLFGVLGIVLNLISRSARGQWIHVAHLLVPPWFLSSWFAPLALFTIYYRFYWSAGSLVEWRDQELAEALLALGFLGFLAHSLSQLRGLKVVETRMTATRLPKGKNCRAAPSPKSS